MKETLQERLQRETREKYLQNGDYSGQTKSGASGAGFYTEDDVDVVIANTISETLKAAVGAIEATPAILVQNTHGVGGLIKKSTALTAVEGLEGKE